MMFHGGGRCVMCSLLTLGCIKDRGLGGDNLSMSRSLQFLGGLGDAGCGPYVVVEKGEREGRLRWCCGHWVGVGEVSL